MNEQMNTVLAELSKPFHPSAITWKPGSVSREKKVAMALAYADVRAYQNRLDDVCGMNWSVSYTPWGDKIICHVTIHGVTRSSTGEASAQSEKNEIDGTSAEAQAFKRACAMFGLGRYLYNLPTVWADYDEGRRQFTDQGKAKLNGVVAAHYQNAMGGHRGPANNERQAPASNRDAAPTGVDADVGFYEEPNPFDDPKAGARAVDANRWAALADGLTGNCLKLAEWANEKHLESEGPATAKQYQFLAGILDEATNKLHGPVLSILCRREVNSDNPCGKALASSLLDLVNPTIKDKESGKRVENPKYRADIVECIKSMATVAIA